MTSPACYCGSSKFFTHCCQPFLNRQAKPSSAEQLMRSRFSAFCRQDFQYLIDTLHRSKHNDNELEQLQQNSHHTHWVKLSILNVQMGKHNDQKGVVEFNAIFVEGTQFYQLHERSCFIREQQQWYYTEGPSQIKPIQYKIGRNEACWCGSGKKFKACHLISNIKPS